MQSILLATDFSERSDRALRRAILLARETGARVELLHVVDDDRPRRMVDDEATEARRLLDELSRSLREGDGIACGSTVLLADPFAGIAQAAAEMKPDLLALGPHRRQLLKDAFVGTTAERAIRSVDCPVLMVNGPPVGPWRHALLTTDLSDASAAALRRFEKLEIVAEASRTLLYVFDAPALHLSTTGPMHAEDREDYLSDSRAAALREMSAFVATLGVARAEMVARHADGAAADAILRAAVGMRSNLIMLAKRSKGAIERMLLGSVTEKVLGAAQIDVLTIPSAPGADNQN